MKVDDDTILVPHNVDELLKEHDPNDKVLLGYAIEAVIDKDTKEFHAQMYSSFFSFHFHFHLHLHFHIVIFIFIPISSIFSIIYHPARYSSFFFIIMLFD